MRRADLERRLVKAAVRQAKLDKLSAGRAPGVVCPNGIISGRGVNPLKKRHVTHFKSFIQGGLYAYDALLAEQKARKLSE